MSRDSTNKAEDYQAAIAAFKPIAQQTTNTLRILAWGQIASCYLQWAQTSPQLAPQLTNSVDYFQRIVDEPAADGSARSIAKVGLAIVLQKQAAEAPTKEKREELQTNALNHYLDVLDGRILRKDESPNPFWTKKAGMDAAQLASTINRWDIAAHIYERLIELLPTLRPMLQDRLLKAQAQAKLAQTRTD